MGNWGYEQTNSCAATKKTVAAKNNRVWFVVTNPSLMETPPFLLKDSTFSGHVFVFAFCRFVGLYFAIKH